MNSILQKQLALDYCCRQEDISSRGNRFTVFRRLNGQRRFDDNAVTDDIVTDGIVTDGGECFLKIAAVNGKLLFCGSETIIPKLESRFRNASGAWFMEAGKLMELQELLGEFGYRIKQFHPFYIADKKTESPAPHGDAPAFDTVFYSQAEILRFRGDGRFGEAFAFNENAPDVLGLAAVCGGEIISMAGASADSPFMWQIGINTMPEAEGMGIGTTLVAMLKNAVLDRGVLPFYGTSVSHIASQRVAVKAGFLPAWAELITEAISKQ